jgi:hypothetical protein
MARARRSGRKHTRRSGVLETLVSKASEYLRPRNFSLRGDAFGECRPGSRVHELLFNRWLNDFLIQLGEALGLMGHRNHPDPG